MDDAVLRVNRSRAIRLAISEQRERRLDTQPATVARLAALEAKVANLEIALASSRCIGMAIGVLMGRYQLTDDQAFTLLIHASQTSHRKLRAIAEDVVFTGDLETAAPYPRTPDLAQVPMAPRPK
ncbi:MAG: ANTAR domain-containing protein [Actinobacteria bacterium]|nr:ANTAR domain-containing protein [Actinomycetota bacterium]